MEGTAGTLLERGASERLRPLGERQLVDLQGLGLTRWRAAEIVDEPAVGPQLQVSVLPLGDAQPAQG